MPEARRNKFGSENVSIFSSLRGSREFLDQISDMPKTDIGVTKSCHNRCVPSDPPLIPLFVSRAAALWHDNRLAQGSVMVQKLHRRYIVLEYVENGLATIPGNGRPVRLIPTGLRPIGSAGTEIRAIPRFMAREFTMLREESDEELMTNESSPPTVFIVDDDDAMLDALTIMAETGGIPVEAFASAQDFLDSYDPERPGCLVVDVRMPHMTGLELQQVLSTHGIELPVVIISGNGDAKVAVQAMKAGAIDFLEKPFKEQDLLNCINNAFEMDAQRRRQQSLLNVYVSRYDSLTPREQEVMQLLVSGRSGKQIAGDLGVSYKTMEKFRGGAMRKMQADSLAELVLMAVDLGLITPKSEAE